MGGKRESVMLLIPLCCFGFRRPSPPPLFCIRMDVVGAGLTRAAAAEGDLYLIQREREREREEEARHAVIGKPDIIN